MFLAVFTVSILTAQLEINIDTSSSTIKWSGSNLFKFNEHYGTVKFTKGKLIKKGAHFTGGSFEIDMNSIRNTDGKYNEMLVAHLKNEDFFDVQQYPFANLQITNIRYTHSNTLEVTANLTIKGKTNPITYTAIVTNENHNTQMVSKFIIDRTLWYVNYESKGLLKTLKDDAISDAIIFEVTVTTAQDEYIGQ